MQHTSREVYEYISKQTSDPIVEWKTCAVSGVEFPIYQSDLDFYDKISPSFAGQKFQIPTPTLCPEERQRRRLSFRNERKLYKRTCDATGKNIISIYSPDKPYTVYDQAYRWSDKRDPMSYGFEFDFSKTFEENFRGLLKVVPKTNLNNFNIEGSDYVNCVNDSNNCYMIYASGFCDLVLYSKRVYNSSYAIDNSYCSNIQESYNNIDSINLYDCRDCIRSQDLRSCVNCKDCSNCDHCSNCSNLKDASYCINNIQLSKEEYHKPIPVSGENSKLIIQSTDLRSSEQSCGNNIINSGSCTLCYDISNSQNIYYGTDVLEYKTSTDVTNTGYGELVYNSIGGGYYHTVICCHFCAEINSCSYSEYCFGCHNLFGCIGLRNKQYCIFNRQYSKEEYKIQVAKIIQHMQSTGERGEFFHPSLSPFGYNETVVQEYFPLTKDEALIKGYARSDYSSDPKIPAGASTLTGDQIPSSITETSDDILKQVLICKVSGRPYMIQKAELEFYRKHNLPIPRKHPDVRHEERMKLRPGRTLYLRTCDCCGEEMLSVYSQEHEGKVFCEECYQKEIFV